MYDEQGIHKKTELRNNYGAKEALKTQTVISAHSLCWASEGATVAQVAMDIARLVTTEIHSAGARDQPGR